MDARKARNITIGQVRARQQTEEQILTGLQRVYAEKLMEIKTSSTFRNCLTEKEQIYWKARIRGLLDAIQLINFNFDETILDW